MARHSGGSFFHGEVNAKTIEKHPYFGGSIFVLILLGLLPHYIITHSAIFDEFFDPIMNKTLLIGLLESPVILGILYWGYDKLFEDAELTVDAKITYWLGFYFILFVFLGFWNNCLIRCANNWFGGKEEVVRYVKVERITLEVEVDKYSNQENKTGNCNIYLSYWKPLKDNPVIHTKVDRFDSLARGDVLKIKTRVGSLGYEYFTDLNNISILPVGNYPGSLKFPVTEKEFKAAMAEENHYTYED